MRIVVDSYAWIELFRGSTEGEKVKNLILESDAVFLPDIVLAEVARKYIREGYGEELVMKRLEWMLEVAEIIGIDTKIAIEASKCNIEMREKATKLKLNTPSFADAIILATTRMKKAKVITGDKHFKDLEETIWIGRHS